MDPDVSLHPPSDQPLTAGDICTLDGLIAFLRGVSPPFELHSVDAAATDAPCEFHHDDIIAVCGNWYDVLHKAPALAYLASEASHTDILLTGGRAERLTPASAEAVGGEPLLLQNVLTSQFGINPNRVILYTGSRVTNHNLRAMLHYAKQVQEFSQQRLRFNVIEEGFLLRRIAAGVAAQLADDSQASQAIADFRFFAVGPSSFEALVSVHRGCTAVALALVVGELDRLKRYSSAGMKTTATHGTVARGAVLGSEALRDIDPALLEALEELRLRHSKLLEAGRYVLEALPREEMLPIAEPTAECSVSDRPSMLRANCTIF
eukprot:TRINITY_DN59504_c0_g1_i1.p1 TRINITY_DN59504_c0_g1~~TRINITY_DN59504_c0_g1_i1.p1  ORF type:complete len:320 (+),score=46.11 TRINITY_DN59504_c0_g1_i1:47-1006(+)